MPYSSYPVGDDVKSLMEASGIEVSSSFNFDIYAEEAAEAWERETRYRPFLAGDSTSYYYDPPGPNAHSQVRGGSRLLFLERGFTSITEVKNAITASDPAGTTLTEGEDYRLLPYNAEADGVPYTSIEFIATQYGLPASIKVTGIPGYCTELSASVWNAVCKLAAASVARAFKEGLAQGLIEYKEDDVTERGSIELVQKAGDSWHAEAMRVARQFMRYF